MGFNEKARAARKMLMEVGVEPSDIFMRYRDRNFVDGFSKFEAVKQVLTGSPSEKTLQYLAKRLSGAQFGQMRDRRSPQEYGFDLVLGWVLEDGVSEMLGRSGVSVVFSGCDRDREFLMQSSVSTDSDTEVNFGGVSMPLELVFDQGRYWSKEGRADFRESKFEKLVTQKALVLGVSVSDSTGFVYHATSLNAPGVRFVKRHRPWGNKPAYSILGLSEMLVPLSETIGLVKEMVAAGGKKEVAA